MQERRNSIANALELRLSCTKPSIFDGVYSIFSRFSGIIMNGKPILTVALQIGGVLFFAQLLWIAATWKDTHWPQQLTLSRGQPARQCTTSVSTLSFDISCSFVFKVITRYALSLLLRTSYAVSLNTECDTKW